MSRIIICGYGHIGRHMYEEFEALSPSIYDPNIPEYSSLPKELFDFAFICVPTEMKEDGSADISIVEQCVKDIRANITIIKSTVPPTTTKNLSSKYSKNIVFSPEQWGATQHAFKKQDFVILGGNRELTSEVAQLYYKVRNGAFKIYVTDSTTAELSKYMLNCFLAMKVTFCNEFADIAHSYDVSYEELRELFCADSRISPYHTLVYNDRPYYDSHCFNKDVPALLNSASCQMPLLSCMQDINLHKKKEYYLK